MATVRTYPCVGEPARGSSATVQSPTEWRRKALTHLKHSSTMLLAKNAGLERDRATTSQEKRTTESPS